MIISMIGLFVFDVLEMFSFLLRVVGLNLGGEGYSPLENFENISKRYQNLVSWTFPKFISTPKNWGRSRGGSGGFLEPPKPK